MKKEAALGLRDGAATSSQSSPAKKRIPVQCAPGILGSSSALTQWDSSDGSEEGDMVLQVTNGTRVTPLVKAAAKVIPTPPLILRARKLSLMRAGSLEFDFGQENPSAPEGGGARATFPVDFGQPCPSKPAARGSGLIRAMSEGQAALEILIGKKGRKSSTRASSLSDQGRSRVGEGRSNECHAQKSGLSEGGRGADGDSRADGTVGMSGADEDGPDSMTKKPRRRSQGMAAEEVWTWVIGHYKQTGSRRKHFKAGRVSASTSAATSPTADSRDVATTSLLGDTRGGETSEPRPTPGHELEILIADDGWGGNASDPTIGQRLNVSQERISDWLCTLRKIVVDVVRTDRHMDFFNNISNLAKATDILGVHAWIDPSTGFCQGMCDILSPFLILFPHPGDAFWCFECLLSRIRQNFLVEGPVGVMARLEALRSVVEVVDPELMLHLSNLDADNFIFAFRMFIVLFRRELPLDDAIDMWERMWAAEYDPQNAATLLQNPPEGINLSAERHMWGAGKPNMDASGSSGTLGSGAQSETRLKRTLWRIPNSTSLQADHNGKYSPLRMTQWGEARNGDEDISVFIVAAILRQNRKKLLQIEGSDEAIKMFNDVELNLDVTTCIQQAIKLQKRYFRKTKKVVGEKLSP